ncbi:MAG TPA: FeoB-associated Cys-rich membrane protein [Pirellulales bacterium]|nr:FeoB-associated Cys-rich membrane protein [Pirellulales bacterium]
MKYDWQDLAALSIVALACGYLLWQGWRLVRRKQPPGGCGGGCAKCPSGSPTEAPVVLHIRLADDAKTGGAFLS